MRYIGVSDNETGLFLFTAQVCYQFMRWATYNGIGYQATDAVNDGLLVQITGIYSEKQLRSNLNLN